MLDVHEPEGEVRGWRGLLTHLFVITLGLLIALALEGGVEWMHHKHVAREARAKLRTEFTDNQATIEQALQAIAGEQKQAEKNLAAFDQIKAAGSAEALVFDMHGWLLARSGWDTARETGAFEYMDYEQVDTWAQLVALEDEFMKHEDQLSHDYARGGMVAARLHAFPAVASKQERNTTADQGIAIVLDMQSELLMCETVGEKQDCEYGKALGGGPLPAFCHS